jgi:hypothetical protein
MGGVNFNDQRIVQFTHATYLTSAECTNLAGKLILLSNQGLKVGLLLGTRDRRTDPLGIGAQNARQGRIS